MSAYETFSAYNLLPKQKRSWVLTVLLVERLMDNFISINYGNSCPEVALLSKEDEMLAELRKIRESLEKAPPPPPPHGLWNEFKDFLSKYKIFGLAIAFIIGLYLGTLVQALVKDLLLPAIGLAIPGMTNLATAMVGPFAYGDFLVALITFLIVAFIAFLAVKVAKKWKID
jgi:large conductance mechanosensitive channel